MLLPYSITKPNKSFTLIELMVVIAVLFTITGAMVPTYISYLKQQTFNNSFVSVRQTLRDVQNRALTGVDTDLGIKYWIVNFNNDGYMYVGKSTTKSVAACANVLISPTEKVIYPTSIVVGKGPNYCTFFDTASGSIYVSEGNTLYSSASYSISINSTETGISSRNLNLTHAGVIF